jgi:hypothetical protein
MYPNSAWTADSKYVRRSEVDGFARAHARFQDQNRNVPERLRGRFQEFRLKPVAQYKFPVAFAAE